MLSVYASYQKISQDWSLITLEKWVLRWFASNHSALVDRASVRANCSDHWYSRSVVTTVAAAVNLLEMHILGPFARPIGLETAMEAPQPVFTRPPQDSDSSWSLKSLMKTSLFHPQGLSPLSLAAKHTLPSRSLQVFPLPSTFHTYITYFNPHNNSEEWIHYYASFGSEGLNNLQMLKNSKGYSQGNRNPDSPGRGPLPLLIKPHCQTGDPEYSRINY